MPENDLLMPRRTIDLDPDGITSPPRATFVELGVASCFSFLRGASDAVDLALQARALGYDALGIADANSMAGVVRLHSEARTLKLRPVIGCRIELAEGLAFLAYPRDRAAYGRLCRLISAGRMGKLDGEWQDKGACDISLAMLADHAEGVQLVLLPPDDLAHQFTLEVEDNVVPLSLAGGPAPGPGSGSGSGPSSKHVGRRILAALADLLPHLVRQLPTMRHIAASYLYRGDDVARIERLDALARANGLAILATNDVHYHAPDRRPLQDVMTAIRHKTTVAAAGHLLHANAERYLKSPAQMEHLFARWPHAIHAARAVADGCTFRLEELSYEYPREIYPDGMDPQEYLEQQTWAGSQWRYPNGLPQSVEDVLERELA
ncbi:MAG TPA: PHP domain-containing protein, partial [Paracoccaceae bacterium]|nr:PHP domain-containing protein [Paracoccaceae bacterium]